MTISHLQSCSSDSSKLKQSLVAIAVANLLMAAPVRAQAPPPTASITVDAECTLIEAIQSANANDSMGNGCENGAYTSTIVLNDSAMFSYLDGFDNGNPFTALPFVKSKVIIEGNGAIIERSNASTNDFRIIAVTDGGDLTLNDATVRNGQLSYGGAGVYVSANSELTLNNATVTNNTATSTGVQGGGVVSVGGKVTIRNSDINNNFASLGGGIYAKGSLTLSKSNVSNNSAVIKGGGFFMADGSLTMSQSSLINNNVRGNGDGSGGGGYLAFASSTIVNTTISQNYAEAYGGGLVIALGDSEILNSTITGNTALQFAGGLSVQRMSLSLQNNIISDNEAAFRSDMTTTGFTTVLYNRNNLFGDSSGDLAASIPQSYDGTNNIYAHADKPGAATIAEILGPLMDNGGPTQMHALVANSPAINKGRNSVCNGGLVNKRDQRGFARLGVCDIGAFEFGSVGPPVPPPRPPFSPSMIVPSVNLLLGEE